MRPDQHALARHGEIADRGDHVGRPDPGAREQDHAVDPVVVLHLLQRRAGFFLRGHHDVVLDQFDASVGQGLLRSGDQRVVDERLAHRVLKPVLVNAVNEKADRGTNHCGSPDCVY